VTTELILVGLSNTFHILATVIWIGWSLVLATLVSPRVTLAYAPGAEGWPAVAVRRLSPLAYLALAALGVTGMYQLVTNPHYVDFLAVTNDWSRLMLIKHLAVLGSGGVVFYLAALVVPEIRFQLRAAERGRDDPDRLQSLAKRFHRLAWLNLGLGAVVLLMTGLATALPSPPS
jgi:uncharacterized membrane protein